eukprot:11638-Heterococcus_DN1.PRE.3
MQCLASARPNVACIHDHACSKQPSTASNKQRHKQLQSCHACDRILTVLLHGFVIASASIANSRKLTTRLAMFRAAMMIATKLCISYTRLCMHYSCWMLCKPAKHYHYTLCT